VKSFGTGLMAAIAVVVLATAGCAESTGFDDDPSSTTSVTDGTVDTSTTRTLPSSDGGSQSSSDDVGQGVSSLPSTSLTAPPQSSTTTHRVSSTTAATTSTTAATTSTTAATTSTTLTTTTTVVRTAPRLNDPKDSAVWAVEYDPSGEMGPLFGWNTTLPYSDNERFEWSECDGCQFEVVTVVHVIPIDYPGFLEVWQRLSTASATYRWRVIATYPDGSEFASETRTFTVYAFTPVTISGTVSDASTGEAIRGARLNLKTGPASWGRTTDGGGVFSFVDGPGGPDQPVLTVSKDGYTTLTTLLNVGESTILNLTLIPEP
jgi:hypothetical protein